MYKVAPIKTSFMMASLVLMLFSFLYLWDLNRPWATAFGILGVIMLIASMISMAKGPLETQLPKKQRRIK